MQNPDPSPSFGYIRKVAIFDVAIADEDLRRLSMELRPRFWTRVHLFFRRLFY